MAVLRPEDVEKEKEGIEKDGVRWFPKAKPLKMLRIFRTRFERLADAENELKRVREVEKYLAPEYMARSNEFLVDYRIRGQYETLLCGLQEYVEGEILDPWAPLDRHALWSLFCRMSKPEEFEAGPKRNSMEIWSEMVREQAEKILGRIKRMIWDVSLIPDLAGVGNLVLTPSGNIKLVDINNIAHVSCQGEIYRDEKGYPVCDKSVEALSLLQQKLLGQSMDQKDPVCGGFLDPVRMKEVRTLERLFHQSKGFVGSSNPVD